MSTLELSGDEETSDEDIIVEKVILNEESHTEKTLTGLYPTELLVCLENCYRPMNFVMCLKKPFSGNVETLIKVMQYCGAEVSFDLSEASSHSVILVNHNDVVPFYAPAFTLTYIEECLEKKQVQEITEYRQEATKDISKDIDCMRVVYFRSKCWSCVLSKEEKDFIDNAVSSTKNDLLSLSSSGTSIHNSSVTCCCNTSNWRQVDHNRKQLIESESESVDQEQLKSSTSHKRKFFNGFDYEIQTVCQEEKGPPNKPNKHSRQPYTKEEQYNIIKYIVERDEYARIKGRELWNIMERQKICPSRTWQSMKEHFIKKIAVNLDQYPFLTNENKRKIQRICC